MQLVQEYEKGWPKKKARPRLRSPTPTPTEVPSPPTPPAAATGQRDFLISRPHGRVEIFNCRMMCALAAEMMIPAPVGKIGSVTALGECRAVSAQAHAEFLTHDIPSGQS